MWAAKVAGCTPGLSLSSYCEPCNHTAHRGRREREIRGVGGGETERESAMSPQNWEIGEQRLLSAGEQEGPQCTTQGGSDGQNHQRPLETELPPIVKRFFVLVWFCFYFYLYFILFHHSREVPESMHFQKTTAGAVAPQTLRGVPQSPHPQHSQLQQP